RGRLSAGWIPGLFRHLFGRWLLRRRTLCDALTFDDLDVSINRQVRELVNFAARPSDFDAVNLRGPADAQDFARVVRGEAAAAARLQATAFHPSRSPHDDRADRAGVALRGDQIQPQPVLPIATLVAQQQRRFAVIRDQYVQVTVVVKIANGHSAGREIPGENGTRLCAHISEAAPGVLKYEQRLFILDTRDAHLDQVVRVAAREKQIRSPSLS